jgi:RPA family protein
MAKKFNLFKTNAEKRAYAIGRKHQYNKEHPLFKWKVQVDSIYMKNGNVVDYKFTDTAGSQKYRTKKEAEAALKRAVKNEKWQKERVLKKSKAGTLNEFDSQDCNYEEFKLVKIHERKK